MRISVSHHSAHKQEAGEIKCPYNQLGQIIKLLNSNKDIRVCIKYNEGKENLSQLYQQLDLLQSSGIPFTVAIEDFNLCKEIISKGYPSFISYPISDWESFSAFCAMGVSDIWIDGPLCFQWDKLEKLSEKPLIRISPTISPNGSLSKGITSFFIRPEDIDLYPIDILDFNEPHQEKEDALFSIYSKKTFLFDLESLVHRDLPPLKNVAFDHKFAERRMKCGQRCKVPDRPCHYCDHYASAIALSAKLLELK